MVQRALASFLPIAWVPADSAYGQEWRLRRTLHEDEEAGVGHVLAVRSSSPFLHRAGSISSSPRRLRKPGNVTPAAERRRGRASMSGPRRSCRPSPTSTVTGPRTTGGSWPAAASPDRRDRLLLGGVLELRGRRQRTTRFVSPRTRSGPLLGRRLQRTARGHDLHRSATLDACTTSRRKTRREHSGTTCPSRKQPWNAHHCGHSPCGTSTRNQTEHQAPYRSVTRSPVRSESVQRPPGLPRPLRPRAVGHELLART